MAGGLGHEGACGQGCTALGGRARIVRHGSPAACLTAPPTPTAVPTSHFSFQASCALGRLAPALPCPALRFPALYAVPSCYLPTLRCACPTVTLARMDAPSIQLPLLPVVWLLITSSSAREAVPATSRMITVKSCRRGPEEGRKGRGSWGRREGGEGRGCKSQERRS